MAEAAVVRASEEENENESSGRLSVANMASGDKVDKRRKTRTSSRSSKSKNDNNDDTDKRFETLENRMEERFTSMMEFIRGSFETLRSREERDFDANKRSGYDDGLARHHVNENASNGPSGTRNGMSRDFNDRPVDVLSITPGRDEREELLSADEQDDGSDDRRSLSMSSVVMNQKMDKFSRYLKPNENNNSLGRLFGEFSSNKENNAGIVLDEAQVEIINNSWRSANPGKLTAYKEEYKQVFPVNEKSQDILKVPVLDDLLEPLLRKNHSAFKAWGKARHLYSHHWKAVENFAYQGQTAARMGLISLSYIQQALALLLDNLTGEVMNVDSAVQSVRDIFEMSTKAMDQMGRSGAFHHVVRRKAAVADTGLADIKELHAKVQNLPLSGDGVFGSGLEEKFKQRKDQKEQLCDLLPEYNASKGYKRKYVSGGTNNSFSGSSRWDSKRQKTNFYDKKNSTWQQRSFQRGRSDRDEQNIKGQDKSKMGSTAIGSFRIPKKR